MNKIKEIPEKEKKFSKIGKIFEKPIDKSIQGVVKCSYKEKIPRIGGVHYGLHRQN